VMYFDFIVYGVYINNSELLCNIRYGLVARIPGFHPGGSGSIPGIGNFFSELFFIRHCQNLKIFSYVNGF
jgi:hypothetical protein